MADKAGDTVEVRTTEQVLIEEYRLLRPDEPAPQNLEQYYERVQGEGQAALCLSGGGIRSAAFALGVLQALSRKGILTGFHYLSTVSGGGYIGSWLQRWIHEEKGDAGAVMAKLGAEREPDEIKRLREYSNFITPRVGLGSNDTWTAVAISLRNILVNWFLFLPLLLLVALLPNWFLSGVVSVPAAVREYPWFDNVLLGLAGASIAISVLFTAPMLPSYRKTYTLTSASGDGWIFTRIVVPIIAWSVFGTLALSADLFELPAKGVPPTAYPGLSLAAATLAGMLVGLVLGMLKVGSGFRRTFARDLIIWPLSFLVVAGAVLLGPLLFRRMAPQRSGDEQWAEKLLTTIGPLWLLLATMLAAVFFVAFRRSEGGTVKPDADREWIARVSGIKFKPMLAWALAGFSALLLMSLLRGGESGGTGDLSLSALVALLAGSGAVAGGRSGRSGGTAGSAAGYVLRFIPFQGLVAVATLLFIVALFVLLGGLEQRVIDLAEKPLSRWMPAIGVPAWIDAEVVAHTAFLLLLIGLLIWFGRIIPVNRFSLNGFYRNRLARAFLGAARPDRKPNPFTGFDSYDNVRMHRLAPEPGRASALYPVINAALNVTSSENLAWQERKAEPFVFTPLFSGSGMLDPRPSGSREARRPVGAYVPSVCYAGSEPDIALGADACGVTLATAMAISGAAASPNMGYHSSPATAFVMTLFNVRLGAWLPNPARAEALGPDIRRSSPNDSLRALLRELAGSTDDKGFDIYLSDGGHFENLGLYEMLRRRCRFIFVSDAGADPECAFTDLGNAVRKAKIDLDVEVSFGRMCISSRNKPVEPQLAWAIGDVHYPEGGTGTILYVKPSYFGDELPVDVVSYASGSETFPHESTADQWFSESQFESYRRLGEYFALRLGADMKGKATIPAFFEAAAAEYERTIAPRDPDEGFLRRLAGHLGLVKGSDAESM